MPLRLPLDLFALSSSISPVLDRRTLLHAAVGTSLAGILRARTAAAGTPRDGHAPGPAPSPSSARPPRARACILLYMAGGPSHIDTFDPKPGRPSGGPFRARPTAVSDIRISEHLPRLGQLMKELVLVRSLTAREGNHDRARHLMHTGHVPAAGVDHPAFGSVVSEARTSVAAAVAAAHPSPGLPGYVTIAGPGQDAGFLSATHSPFPVKNPQRPVKYLRRAPGIDDRRWQRRLALWRVLETRFANERGGAFAQSRRAISERAIALMDSGVDAFDLAREPDDLRARYGDAPFGAGCLMARRLVQAGVPFVEVTLPGWDTHTDNFSRVAALSATLDQSMSALLEDLRATGLLSSTLVLWMGDFGRTPRINENGGRDHHPAASTVVLAGAGLPGGQVIGATDDDGDAVRAQPVTVADLYRTVAVLAGVDPDRMRMSPAGRPIRTVDGGTALSALL